MKENKPIISFILTYYNLPIQMLCECIDSILALSMLPSEREIIVIDDGSETSPMNGLMQYGDDIIYMRQKNQGVSVARNTGIQMSKGQYIQFVDGDDYLLKIPYEHCIDIIRKRQDIEMVLFDYTTSNDTQSNFSDSSICSGTEYMLHNNLRGSACGYFVKRNVLSELRFTPGIANGEDEEFTAQMMLRVESLIATNAKAYNYRQRKESAVHKQDNLNKQKRLDDTFNVLKSLYMKVDRLPVSEKQAMQRRVAQLTMDYIYNIIMLTHSQQELTQRLEELRQEGLFPLPDRDYSQKYKWFRKMSNTRLGRTIMLNTLPFIKKER